MAAKRLGRLEAGNTAVEGVQGGKGAILLAGDFNSLTVTMEASADGETWVPVQGASFTSPVYDTFDFLVDTSFSFRVFISGSGTGAAVDVWVGGA